ncbi:conjugal transfer nickase/helicase domain-containing protein [Pseudomonas batumici]|uniref:conjugal transfer nickase/helicase domain-containing protein n=1 Tax=Pseudomonas batumici TaxID=226910 RepID=UPI003BAE1FA1
MRALNSQKAPSLHTDGRLNVLAIQIEKGGTITLNDAHAPVHSVARRPFWSLQRSFSVTPRNTPETARMAKEQGTSDWRWVQRCFEKLGLHHKSEEGLNIWVCEVKGPRKTRSIKGYLLKDPSLRAGLRG